MRVLTLAASLLGIGFAVASVACSSPWQGCDLANSCFPQDASILDIDGSTDDGGWWQADTGHDRRDVSTDVKDAGDAEGG